MRLYIAGPYKATERRSVKQNINLARYVAIMLTRAGHQCFVPHLNSAHFEEWCPDVPESQYLEFDGAVLQAILPWERTPLIEAVVMLPGWQHSANSGHERTLAQGLGKAIYHWPDDAEELGAKR